jgi:predicted metal-dependent HD superfamily phosphohydrolase
MIQQAFISSIAHYAPLSQCESLWQEVEQAYQAEGRHYHTLPHLNHLLSELTPFQSHFKQWDAIVLAIVYHDIVYRVPGNDNEKESADLAENRLQSISFPIAEIDQCKRLIMATKKHKANDREIDLFTDADLSILGAEPEAYQQYAAQVRKEYQIFPDPIYNQGRKKVLSHFLHGPVIFKTPEFFEKYERAARINLQWEAAKCDKQLS